MVMRKVLIDTNAYIQLLSGNKDLLDALADAEIVYMSVFVLGELFAGFKGGTREKKNRKILDEFLDKPVVTVLESTVETAEIFGMVKYELKKAGTPLPMNDVWIASHAIESGSVLITYDAHFEKVKGVRLLAP